MIIEHIERSMAFRAELGDRQHEFIISNAAVDSYGTVFLPSGWDLSLRQGGKKYVTYGHPYFSNPDPNVIIGIGEERIEEDMLMSILTLEPAGTNPIADAVEHKLRFGSLTDASIVAEVLDGRPGRSEIGEDPDIFYFTKQRLYNWGVVMQGSNPDAVKTRSAIESFIQSKVNVAQSSKQEADREEADRALNILRALKTRYYSFS